MQAETVAPDMFYYDKIYSIGLLSTVLTINLCLKFSKLATEQSNSSFGLPMLMMVKHSIASI